MGVTELQNKKRVQNAYCQLKALCEPKFLMSLAMLICLVVGAGPASSAGIKLVQSNSQGVKLSVDDLSITWQELSLKDGSVVLFKPMVAGFPVSGEPGKVGAPSRGGWLLVPPGTTPEITSNQENWESAGNRPLMVQPVPSAIESENSDFISMSETLVLPGDVISDNLNIPGFIKDDLGKRSHPYTGSALVLGDIVWWRGHRIVSWQLNLLRHDGAVASESLTSGSWQISFETGKASSAAVPAGHLRKFPNTNDVQFSGNFLNGNLLDSMPTEASYRGLSRPEIDNKSFRGLKSGTLLGNVEGRLSVQKSNLYRVTYDRLQTLGYLPSQDVEERQIRLYQRRYLDRLDDGSGQAPYVEIEVPIKMYGEGDDFEGDDFFVFYGLRLRDDVEFSADVGQGPESIYGCGDSREMNNEGNYYWVAAAEPDQGNNWARMAEQSFSPASTTPLANYRRVEHFEERVSYRQESPNETIDRIFWNERRSTEVSIGFNPLWNPDPNGAQGLAEVQVAGYYTLSTQTLEFDLVTDNTLTTPLDDFVITNNSLSQTDLLFNASALNGAASKLVMNNASDGYLNSYLDWVKLSYDALYRAVGNTLKFHGGEGSGARPIVVTGFTTDDLGMIEITDARNPVFVALGAGNVLADGENWKLSIEPTQSAGQREFIAVRDLDGSGVGEFHYYSSSLAENQINPVEILGANPDLVVITHSEFREAIQPWITHRINRAGGDLAVHVVTVESLYDWYSGGLKDPWALKRFTTHAINEWGSWALMLVGDANENVLELGVLPHAKPWATDWVPTHYHVQDTSQYAPEVLASDKWFASFDSGLNYPVEDFPTLVQAPWQMYVGRFPCNSVSDLNAMINKVKIVENVQPNQDWRKRAILMADDHWSEGLLGGGNGGGLILRSWERAFADVERDVFVPLWNGGTPVTMATDTLFLDNYLKPYWLEHGSPEARSVYEYQSEVTNGEALDDLLQSLSQGGLFVHYQGHANSSVLCSEYWIQDGILNSSRQDISFLANASSPWVFFGMGCHIADWAQDPVKYGSYVYESSLGEKFLTRNGGGASAVYASSGFEYISHNEVYGDLIINRWTQSPPSQTQVPSSGGAQDIRSRWMIGELMWYCEADILATYPTSRIYREMVSQYTLLGDPLMMLDAGPPDVTAILSGEPDEEISGEIDLVGVDATNMRTITIDARDEAGISHVKVRDNAGGDLTETVVVSETRPDGQTDDQQVQYSLEVPLRPFDHQIRVEVFDTASNLDADYHYSLLLNINQDAVFTAGGEDVDPDEFSFLLDIPVDFQCEMTSSAWLHDGMQYDVVGDNLTVSNVNISPAKSNNVSLSFTAVATFITDEDRSVVLVIDGNETNYVLESNGGGIADATISQVLNYPNPMRDGTRFVFETTAATGEGNVRVFAVSGRAVASIAFTYSGGNEGIIEWNGRDDDGDGLANGTYLYRLEMNTPSGLLVSPMQRLVVMN